ncbi:MAG: LPS export ABC transporter periplasmic protein LptC [Methylophilaceae bacterium]
MKGLPAIWFGLMLLALLTALTFWIDKIAEPLAAKRDGSNRHDPDYIVNNFSTLRTNGFGNPRYRLEGTEMRHYPDDDSTDLTKPRFSMYSLKKPTTQILADRGQVSANGENVYFMDNVKVVRAATQRKAEMTLVTDYLHIIPDQDLAQTDRPVTILQEPRTVIHANAMQFYKKQGVLNLQRHVKVHYERPNAPPSKALSIEQVAGSKPRIMPSSVVRPQLDSLIVPPAVKAVMPVKADPVKANPVNMLEMDAPLQVPAAPATQEVKPPKPKNKSLNKKSKAKKDTQAKPSKPKPPQAKKSKEKIRRHYENP